MSADATPEGATARPAKTEPSAEPLLDTAQRYLLGNYRQAPFVLERGQGSELWDTTGRRYLDLCAGVAVSSLGHDHPRLVAALTAQAAKLIHTSNYFFNAPNVRLAEALCTRTGFDRAFFCNSGAEAIEALLKLARRYFYARGEASRYKVIAFHNAFHGRTLGALAATGTPKYHEGFGPLSGVTHLTYGDIGAVRSAMSPEIAAILVEPVQGEGGVLPAPPGFLPALRRLADEHGALLLVDEVQTGIGRTGRFLACEHEDVRADGIALAKGLGGGYPIGAMLCREQVGAALTPGTHGSTFGGGPLASIAALTVLEVLEEEGLIAAAESKGARLSALLSDLVLRHPRTVVEERGMGLFRGLRVAAGVDVRTVLNKARDKGVLLTVAGADVLRFTPPLVVRESELEEGARVLDAVLCELEAS
jgi:acetylornithine/N-succinyldiaminopimelate aminotransferase